MRCAKALAALPRVPHILPHFTHSSGDIVADRRAEYARAAALDHAHAEAAEIMAQALELAPGWAAGWCLLGDYRSEAGDAAGAIAAYEELARLDAEGVFGAVLKLAALGAAPAPKKPEIPYIESLFDDYADRFEAELVLGLGYEAPMRLAEQIETACRAFGIDQVSHAIDLGCGTGLMGERLRRRASFVEGVDLSGAMIEAAGRKGIYDRLEQAELTAFLAASAQAVDLIVAADVLNYCGALPPVFNAAAGRLAPGGVFACTLERHVGSEPLILQSSLRYAHSEAAVRAACSEAGLELVSLTQSPLRHDRGEPVIGLYLVARKPVMVAAAAPEPADDAQETSVPLH